MYTDILIPNETELAKICSSAGEAANKNEESMAQWLLKEKTFYALETRSTHFRITGIILH